jgi:hypothetical protein
MITKLNPVASLYGLQSKGIQPEGKFPLAIPQLEPGKILSATVAESRGQNIFMLETRNLQFAVTSKIPLVKGEQIQFQVVRTTPVLELQKIDQVSPLQNLQSLSLTGDVVNVKPLLQNLQNSYFAPQATATGQQTAQPTLQKMDVGQLDKLIHQQNFTVKATVLENLGDNKSLVRIDGETYTLNGQVSVKTGESQVLQLQSLQPTPSFFPVNNQGVVDKSQPLLLSTESQTLPALVRALQLPLLTGLDMLQPTQQKLLYSLQNLQPAQLQEPGAGELLKTNMEQLGLRSEALVAHGKGEEAATQLKSVLAEIVKIFQGQERISSSAHHILATIENSQFVQTNLQPENGLLFPLPFSFLEKGYLLVDQDGEQQDTRDETQKKFSCTLHLALEGLGNVRVRCIQDMESVRIAFYLDSQETADFVSTFQNELKEKISSAPLLSLSFASGAEPPGSALLQMILPGKHPILDTNA